MSNFIKIKYTCGWDSTESITKRVSNQFLTPNINNQIKFVCDDSYDVIVYNNYINEPAKLGSKSYIFFHEPSWSGNHQKNFTDASYGQYDLTVFGYDRKNYNISNCKFIECPSKLLYGGRGPWTEGHDFWTYNNLIKSELQKTKIISSVVSSLGSDGNFGPNGCLYKERSELIAKLINDINYIDFFGWGKNETNLKGGIAEKKDGLVDYMFSLCIENSNEKNYITEKFFDCILTNTIPIYYGCSNIKELIPENCYILLENILDYDKILDTLENVLLNYEILYKKMLPELIKFKERYFVDFNPLQQIVDLQIKK